MFGQYDDKYSCLWHFIYLHFQNLVKRPNVLMKKLLAVDRKSNMCEMTAQLYAVLSEHGAEMMIFK